MQVSTVDDFTAKLQPGEPLADVVEPLGIRGRLDRLERLNRMMEGELATAAADVTQEKVDSAFADGQYRLHRLFVRILATYDELTPAALAEQARLLAPIVAQNERVGELNRRTRRVVDVDPETGVEEGTTPTPPTS